jgi:hypothetical protein
MSIIHSSAPARIEKPSTFVPPAPEVKAAMRAHVAKVVSERNEAGLYADGRIADMAKYAKYIAGGGKL